MADKANDKLKVQLTLKWLQGKDFEATVAVEITDSCYHEVDLKVGLPPGTVGVPEIEYLTYTFTHDTGKACSDIVRTVKRSIKIVFSDAKPKVTAFAVVNGQVAGSDTKPFPKGN
jgi:hypothetical protein